MVKIPSCSVLRINLRNSLIQHSENDTTKKWLQLQTKSNKHAKLLHSGEEQNIEQLLTNMEKAGF